MSFLRYDETNLIGAGARVLFAPVSVAVPATGKDIFDQVDPYDPKTGWIDFGATSAGPQISRNLTTAGFNIQQDQSTILEEPTEITRTLTVPIAEFRPEIIAMFEESASSVVAAAVKLGSGKKVPFGNIFSLSEFRLALAARKSKKQGIVTEGSGGSPVTRGAFFIWSAYRASLAGDNLQTTIARGDLANASVQFKLAPEPTVTTEGQEYGFWLAEDAPQTIALT
jgi:hypothetical protein